jgi:hypothetical protein
MICHSQKNYLISISVLRQKILYFFVIISTPQETDEIRTENLFAGRFHSFPEGRTSGEAALSAHNEEREAFRAWVLNRPRSVRPQRGTRSVPSLGAE